MKKLKLESLDRQKDFTMIDCNNFEVVFTNAEMNRSFNRNTEEGINEINSLQKEFNVDDVIYLKQIHSDKVLEYKSNIENIKKYTDDKYDNGLFSFKNTSCKRVKYSNTFNFIIIQINSYRFTFFIYWYYINTISTDSKCSTMKIKFISFVSHIN